MVRDDVMFGFVSRQQAADVYGVVFAGAGDIVDEAATERRRAELARQARAGVGIYAYGPDREQHDRIWNAEGRRALVGILDSLSITARIYAKNMIMIKALELREQRSLPSIGASEIEESWASVRARLGLAQGTA
jgi:N-methylhydantoinase B